MIARPPIEDEIRELDAELRQLTRLGVEMSGPRLLERLREGAEAYRRRQPEREAALRQANNHLPALLDLYMKGDDGDRQWVRDLLHAFPTFRWALGGKAAGPQMPANAEQALRKLALLSMKDGESDPRDQWVWLQGLCSAARQSGLDVPPLLRQAAAWSSDTPRFPPTPSTRALLLQFAERFGS
jgi:hypothetical protein